LCSEWNIDLPGLGYALELLLIGGSPASDPKGIDCTCNIVPYAYISSFGFKSRGFENSPFVV